MMMVSPSGFFSLLASFTSSLFGANGAGNVYKDLINTERLHQGGIVQQDLHNL